MTTFLVRAMVARVGLVVVFLLAGSDGAAQVRQDASPSVTLRVVADQQTLEVGDAIGFRATLANNGGTDVTYLSLHTPGRAFYKFVYRPTGGREEWLVNSADRLLLAGAGGTVDTLLHPGNTVIREDYAMVHRQFTQSPPKPHPSPRMGIAANLRNAGLEFVVPGDYEFFLRVRLRGADGSVQEVDSNVVAFEVKEISREQADLLLRLLQFRVRGFVSGSYDRVFDQDFICALKDRPPPMLGRRMVLDLARLYIKVASTDTDARKAQALYRTTLYSFGPSMRVVLGDIDDAQYQETRHSRGAELARERYWSHYGRVRALLPLRCDQ